MKTLFIEAKYTGKISLTNEAVSHIPNRIGLLTTVQFAFQIEDIKSQLIGKKVIVPKGKQKHYAQVLGCDVSASEAIKDKVDAFLYIGSGEFHPLGIALKTGKTVFCFNPLTSEFSEINQKDVENHKKRKKGALIRLISSKSVGILVSTKPGQANLKKAIELKEKLTDKDCYIFAFDTLNIPELENFNFIDCWINTACPRIEGRGIIGSDEITF